MNQTSRSPEYGRNRRTVSLARIKIAHFTETVRRRDQNRAAMVYAVILDAARRARAGLPLPPAGSEPSGGSSRAKLEWSQPADEMVRITRLLEDSGSSIRDVVGAFVEVYTATDGDLLAAMEGYGVTRAEPTAYVA